MRKRRGLSASLTVVGSSFFALLSFELILRALQLGYGNAPLISDPLLHHVHPKNYEFRVHSPNGEYGGYLIKYDGDGLVVDPNDRNGTKSPLGGPEYRVAFMGDSFVEAVQVPYRESFVGRIAGAVHGSVAVRNYGVSSYSPAVYDVQWRHSVAGFHPTHVFMLLYSNDIRDDEGFATLGKYDSSGRLVAIPGPGGGRIVEALRQLYTVRLARKAQLRAEWLVKNRNTPPQPQLPRSYLEENPDITGLSAGFVRDVADGVRRTGAEFVLMVVPSKYRLLSASATVPGLEFADKWKLWAEKENIRYLDLPAAFREAKARQTCEKFFFAVDIHLTSCGHRVLADAVCRSFPEICGS